MIDLLVAANRDVADGPISDDRMAQINADYTAILAKGVTIHPINKRKDGTAHRKQSTPTNLLRRLREYRIPYCTAERCTPCKGHSSWWGNDSPSSFLVHLSLPKSAESPVTSG